MTLTLSLYLYLSLCLFRVAEMVYSMLPPHSILTVASHPASRQFEVQRLVERGIVETIKLDWESDRMTFGFN